MSAVMAPYVVLYTGANPCTTIISSEPGPPGVLSFVSIARRACLRPLEEQDTLFTTIFASPSAMDLQLEHMQVMDLQLEHMHVLHSSVYAWRRCENKVRTDPTLLGGRRRLIVCWGTAAVGGLDVLYHQAPKVAAREPARAACAQNAGAHPPGGGMMVIVQSTQVLDWQRSKSHLIYERVAVILSRCLTACFISSCTEVLRRRSFLLPQ